jgi:hypothetical protein
MQTLTSLEVKHSGLNRMLRLVPELRWSCRRQKEGANRRPVVHHLECTSAAGMSATAVPAGADDNYCRRCTRPACLGGTARDQQREWGQEQERAPVSKPAPGGVAQHQQHECLCRRRRTRCGPLAQPQVVGSRVEKRGRTRRIAQRATRRTRTRTIAVVRRWGTPFRESAGPCAGAGYQSGDSWLGWPSAEVAGQAARVTQPLVREVNRNL